MEGTGRILPHGRVRGPERPTWGKVGDTNAHGVPTRPPISPYIPPPGPICAPISVGPLPLQVLLVLLALSAARGQAAVRVNLTEGRWEADVSSAASSTAASSTASVPSPACPHRSPTNPRGVPLHHVPVVSSATSSAASLQCPR